MKNSLDFERYIKACHGMQSGVATEMHFRSEPTEPKHLRVGINTALRDHASLVELLIAKGVLTEEEYMKAAADGMEEEVKRYEAHLSKLTGATVILK